MRRVSLTAMLLVACGRDAKEKTADGGRQTAETAIAGQQVASTPIPPSPVRCPPSGLWAVCHVMDRLDRAGLVPRADTTTATEPPLTARGTQIIVGKAQLELYVYPDNRSRETEQRLLDKTKYVSFDSPLTMQSQPTLIYSANLIAILHSRNDHLRERVADAITAGPPQPPTSTKP